MFRRVLFPTDLSSYATAVLNCLPDLRACGLRNVVLLNVISPEQVALGHGVGQDLLQEVRQIKEQKLELARRALQRTGLSVRSRLEEGVPAVEIVRVAREESVQLIVIGAQGRTLLRDLLLGSVAWEVARRSPVPVLVEKLEVAKEFGAARCRRVCADSFKVILHPTDFSDCANAAFQVVKRLQPPVAGQVILLHVQDERVMQYCPQQQRNEFDREDIRRLEQMQKSLSLNSLPNKVLLRTGIPFIETLKVAEEENVSLIVLGTRGRSLIPKMVAGSTFENVVRHSRRPVLAACALGAGDQG